MSEESTQVFRGSDAPEITFAESRTASKPKPAAAPPAEQRTLSDAKDGPADSRTLPADAADAGASQRTLGEAGDPREPQLRQLHDSTALLPPDEEPAPAPDAAQPVAGATAVAQGLAEVRTWQDTSVAAPAGAALRDSTVMLPPADAIADSTATLPLADAAGDGRVVPSDARQLNDTAVALPAAGTLPPQEGVIVPAHGSDNRGGPADARRLQEPVVARPGANFQPDAESLPPAAAQRDERDGLAELRQREDVPASVPAATGAPSGMAAPAAQPETAAAATGGISDPDLTFQADDATPWALSIHLQERIASLGVSTARVGHQLDALEESIKRLGKRIKK